MRDARGCKKRHKRPHGAAGATTQLVARHAALAGVFVIGNVCQPAASQSMTKNARAKVHKTKFAKCQAVIVSIFFIID